MTVHYLPTVTLDDETLPSSWDGSSRAALGGLEIDWGREELYDDVRPAVIKVRVIDPDGEWATSHDRQGSRLIITVPGGRVMARARVNHVDVEREEVWSPVTEETAIVWIATLTCSDPLADLDAAIMPGPGVYNASFDEYGDQFWPNGSNQTTRKNWILAAGAADYVASIAAPNFTPVSPSFSFREYNFADNRSLLALIEGMYNMIPLGHVNYDPSTQGITCAVPATNPGRKLVYTAGEIEILPNSGSIIPAERIHMLDGYRVSSTIANAVDIVQINWIRLKTAAIDNRNFVEMKTPANTSRYDPADAGRRILQIDTDLFFYEAYALALATAVVALVNGVNGRFDLPLMRFDFRRGTTGDLTTDNLLLSVYDQPVPITFPGSAFGGLPNVGSSFQLIGGLTTWHGRAEGSRLEEGWTVDLTLAPTVGVLTPVTLLTYVTNATAQLDDFDPTITLNDFHDVTVGAA